MVKAFQAWVMVSLLLAGVQASAQLDALLERGAIEEGDVVRLQITSTEGELDQLDLSPLEKDFTVVSQSRMSSTSLVNGSLTRSEQLMLGLQPKHSGDLVIPPLTLAGETTQSLALKVLPAQQLTLEQGGVELLVTASSLSPKVQQPVIYRMTLFIGQQLYNASLEPPAIISGDALMEPLGEQQQYQQQLKGRNVTVVEQIWAITPQKSGTLVIKPPRLMAQVPAQNRRVKRISAVGDQLTLTVGAVPAAFKGPSWLPAEQVTMTEQWSSEALRAGEPVTRTITLQVEGIGKEQLPPLTLPEGEGIKQYAAAPEIDEQFNGDTLITTLTQAVTLIPERAGKVTLPAVRLPWWSIVDNQQQSAELAARTLTVAAGVTPSTPQVLPEPQPRIAPPAEPAAPVVAVDSDRGIAPWLWGIAGLLVGGLLGWYMPRRQRLKPSIPPARPSVDIAALQQRFQQACLANDASAARAALLQWAGAVDPNYQTLTQIIDAVPAAREPLIELEQVLYAAPTKTPWQGADLGQIFRSITFEKKPPPSLDKGQLRPLYPHQV